MSTLALPTNSNTARHGLTLPGSTSSALPSSSTSPANPSGALPPQPPSSTIIAAPPRRQSLAIPGVPGPSQRSPSVDLKELDGEEDEGEDDDEDGDGGGKGKKKGSGGKAGKKVQEAKVSEYKYSSEISQMMFVFGEVQDPLPETVKLVEDVVRGQIIEIVTRARLLTHLRSSRFLSAEDLIFLIRDDRGKVNRLRTYLSWKDVRKKAKEDEEGDLDVDDADKAAPKGRKSMVKLPWERLTPFGDFLRGLPSKNGGRGDEDEDEDEDEMQAYQDSMQRLKDADEITKKMTRDEYVHYSDCRQASFTYRKARRFRDFVNFPAYLDVKPNDDIVDILGFLSFEMVRSLCVTALAVRDRMERPISLPTVRKNTLRAPGSPIKRKREVGTGAGTGAALGESPTKRLRPDGTGPNTGQSQIVASPEAVTPLPNQSNPSGDPAGAPSTGRKHTTTTATVSTAHGHVGVSLFAAPPSAKQPLLPAHVLEAFAQIQREQAASKTRGMSNFRGGGFGRGKIALV